MTNPGPLLIGTEVSQPVGFVCDFCGLIKKTLTIWRHNTGKFLYLCFRGCQHFPEPFRRAGYPGCEWDRVDPWIQKRAQPKLSKSKRDWRDQQATPEKKRLTVQSWAVGYPLRTLVLSHARLYKITIKLQTNNYIRFSSMSQKNLDCFKHGISFMNMTGADETIKHKYIEFPKDMENHLMLSVMGVPDDLICREMKFIEEERREDKELEPKKPIPMPKPEPKVDPQTKLFPDEPGESKADKLRKEVVQALETLEKMDIERA